jgi:hypothetical protein
MDTTRIDEQQDKDRRIRKQEIPGITPTRLFATRQTQLFNVSLHSKKSESVK